MVCGFWLVLEITSVMIFIAYVHKYNPTYRVTLTANPTRETKHQIGMALYRGGLGPRLENDVI